MTHAHRRTSNRTKFTLVATAYGWWFTGLLYWADEPKALIAFNLALTLYLTHKLHGDLWTNEHGSNA